MARSNTCALIWRGWTARVDVCPAFPARHNSTRGTRHNLVVCGINCAGSPVTKKNRLEDRDRRHELLLCFCLIFVCSCYSYEYFLEHEHHYERLRPTAYSLVAPTHALRRGLRPAEEAQYRIVVRQLGAVVSLLLFFMVQRRQSPVVVLLLCSLSLRDG